MNLSKKIKDKMRNILIKNRYRRVSDVKLKDLFLNTDKSEVIDFAIKHINVNDNYKHINELIVFEIDTEYRCPINNREYLEGKYDYFYNLCKKGYENNLSSKYAISSGYGFPWNCGEFLGLIEIEENCEAMNNFMVSSFEKEVLTIDLILDCRIEKDILSSKLQSQIVALFVLQSAFIEELNKN
ncbi:MAG: hypothetical protein RR835_02435 [Peptostreptococcaceae bacterium]